MFVEVFLREVLLQIPVKAHQHPRCKWVASMHRNVDRLRLFYLVDEDDAAQDMMTTAYTHDRKAKIL